MSKKRYTAKAKKPYTATDAVKDTVEIVVVTPVCWVFEKTVGRLLDAV